VILEPFYLPCLAHASYLAGLPQRPSAHAPAIDETPALIPKYTRAADSMP